MIAASTKTCCKCKVEKPYAQFPRDSNRGDGYYPRCNECRKVSYRENVSQSRITTKAYREKNRQRINEWNRRYAVRRFFWLKAANLKLKAEICASYVELAQLWKIQRGVCTLTNRRLNRENCQLDHIIPLSRGGSSTIENLRWVHRDANYAKRDLFDAEFVALCQDVVLANLTKERS